MRLSVPSRVRAARVRACMRASGRVFLILLSEYSENKDRRARFGGFRLYFFAASAKKVKSGEGTSYCKVGQVEPTKVF